MLSVANIISKLPSFANQSETLVQNQKVKDIITELLEAHEFFKNDYDKICSSFDAGNVEDTLKNLFTFLKENVRYQEETEEVQTVRSPGAILLQGCGDCKHYASFVGGVLDGLRRQGKKINFVYRFAGYDLFTRQVAHVFIVVKSGSGEIWCDPVLKEFNQRRPAPVIYNDYKFSEMINRITGIETNRVPTIVEFGVPGAESVVFDLPPMDKIEGEFAGKPTESPLPPDITEAVKMLSFYGIIDPTTQTINDTLLMQVASGLGDQDATDLFNAFGLFTQYLEQQKISGLFDAIWDGVKTVALAPLRGAYLGLVALNVFNLAGRLHKVLYDENGQLDETNLQRVRKVWVTRFEGHTDALLSAVNRGHKKKAILGAAPAAAVVPAWIAVAGAIIAAMSPLIKAILAEKSQTRDDINFSDITGDYGTGNIDQYSGGGSGVGGSIKQYLPYILIGGAALYFVTSQKKSNGRR